MGIPATGKQRIVIGIAIDRISGVASWNHGANSTRWA